MNRVQNVTQTVTHGWRPFVIASRWADNPDEVPTWDPSRGWPLTLMDNVSFAARDAPTGLYPRLVRERPPEIVETQGGAYEKYENSHEDVLRKYGCQYADMDIIKDVITQIPKDALITNDVNVLKPGILKLANKYGSPFSYYDHTYESWKQLISHIFTEWWIWKEFKTYGFQLGLNSIIRYAHVLASELNGTYGYSIPDLDKLIDQAESRGDMYYGVNGIAWHGLTECPDHKIVELYHVGRFYHFLSLTFGSIGKPFNQPRSDYVSKVVETKILQMHVASDYLEVDGGNCSIRASPYGVTVQGPVGIWIHYKIADLWREDKDLAVCTVCGTSFVQKRRDMKYCGRSACKTRAHRQRARME